MDVSFVDGRLARECNSSARLRARWGDLWTSVARRLLQIAAAARVADLALLPYAQLSGAQEPGTYDVTFGEGIMIRLVAVDDNGNPVATEAGGASVVEIQIVSISAARKKAA
ncbi:hypothetical protein [Phytohabitans kaempferiae]|uniref:Uncharacterized protein n=1 Tax=Phytohabitans kaempferiae TaxID=1620943 RepID=A0ABV6M7Z1_9ACTN